MYFLVKFDSKGELVFANKKSEYKWNKIKEFYIQNGNYFTLSFEETENNSTRNQHLLFYKISNMVAEETGDDVLSVQQALFENCLPVMTKGDKDLFGREIIHRIPLEQLTTKEFGLFLERVIVFCNEFFNMTINLNYNDR